MDKNKWIIFILFTAAFFLFILNVCWASSYYEEKNQKEEEDFILARVLSVEEDGAYVYNSHEFNSGVAYVEYIEYNFRYYVEVGDEVIMFLDDGGTKGNPQWVIVGWLDA